MCVVAFGLNLTKINSLLSELVRGSQFCNHSLSLADKIGKGGVIMDPNFAGAYGNYSGSGGSDAAVATLLAFFVGFFVIIAVILVVIHIFMAVCLMKIAHKTNTPNAWFAWIPILNIVLMLQIAKKPVWWIILLFIPFVNIVWVVLQVLVWMAISRECGKEEWLGILIIVPVANIIVPAYLAFSNNHSAPVQTVPPVQPVV
jgi:hypothetical protein